MYLGVQLSTYTMPSVFCEQCATIPWHDLLSGPDRVFSYRPLLDELDSSPAGCSLCTALTSTLTTRTGGSLRQRGVPEPLFKTDEIAIRSESLYLWTTPGCLPQDDSLVVEFSRVINSWNNGYQSINFRVCHEESGRASYSSMLERDS